MATIEKLKNKSTTKKKGGKRPGAGRKRGGKNKATIEKQIAEEAFKQRVLQSLDPLFHAQLSLGTGQQYLYKIEKTKIVGPRGGVSYQNKKPVIVTDPEEIRLYFETVIGRQNGDIEDDKDPAATYYYITAQSPENKAIDSMIDRVFGKAPQNHTLSDRDGNPLQINIINYGGNNNTPPVRSKPAAVPAKGAGKPSKIQVASYSSQGGENSAIDK